MGVSTPNNGKFHGGNVVLAIPKTMSGSPGSPHPCTAMAGWYFDPATLVEIRSEATKAYNEDLKNLQVPTGNEDHA